MGHRDIDLQTASRALLGLLAAALFLLALPPRALAAPTHPRSEALDVTGLNHACGAATDSKGDLYLSSAGGSAIKVYDPSHNLLASIADANTPCGLAVSPTGVLYVSEQATGEVVRFKPNAYPFSGPPTYGAREVIDASGKGKGIAVDPFDSALYVAEGDRVGAYVHEMQTVWLRGQITGGTFNLIFEGQPTASLPYNASAAEAQAALGALSTIGAGNVEVWKPTPWRFAVLFTGKFAYTDVSGLSSTKSFTGTENPRINIPETAKGFSGKIGEGTLLEATGIASHTVEGDSFSVEHTLWVADANGLAADRLLLFGGTSASVLKPRREVSGAATPDGSFGFGAAGAYLAADPGNVELETKKCAIVGKQACTAGHIYLYDAAHKVLDELDGSGEYLGQTENAAFADAEPTAVAIDRSGGANDGTLYVTAGAAAGAGALAFGPLLQPERKALPEPVSRVLESAQAVATDSHGDVYVAAGSQIHIYEPDGTELLTAGKAPLEDPKAPSDLAVDSACNVYVLDGGTKVTYYAPSACPPVPGATYTRHEPVVATGTSLRGIAVNPGPAAGKDHLFVTDPSVTREYDSAAGGSTLLNGEFAKGLFSNNRESIAVNGANGNVYIGTNGSRIYVISPKEGPRPEEVLARINTSVSPGGETSANTSNNPHVAVDQANGHVIEFDKSKAAHEYDAVSESFVAEFGNFTQNLGAGFRVAVDNACALHEPPLTGAACEAFDPAAGNVYVAYDDTNLSHPPYDVSAFGRLGYSQAGEAPTVKTGAAREFAPAAATLRGTVDPNEAEIQECAFEYLTDAQYQANTEAHPGDEEAAFEGAETEDCAESAEEIGAGSDPVAVHARVEGLDPVAPYRFRLIARNAGGTEKGEAVLFGPPLISPKNALPVLYSEATLRAEVNPSGLATEYRFEYLDRESFEEQGGFEGPATHRSAWTKLPAGEEPVAVSAVATGLVEGSEYRYRLVAKNEAATIAEPTQSLTTQSRRGAEGCANSTYRFGPSAALPDCRAYELATPAQTDGLVPYAADSGGSGSGNFDSWLTEQRGAGAGEDLAYFIDGTLPGFEGNGRRDGYRAERGAGDHPAGGWQSTLVSPDYAQAGGGQPGVLGVASDQLYSVWETSPPETFSGTLSPGVHLRTPDGFEALGRGGGTEEDPGALIRYLSAGGAHVIFSSKAHLEPAAPPAGVAALYDRSAGSGTATVLSSPPPGASSALEAEFETQDAAFTGTNEGGASVAFSLGGTLYLHREGQTTEIAEAPFAFAGISGDGGRVFYAETTDGETPAPLLACDVDAGPCAGEGAHPPTQIATEGVFALVSPDGSHAFFSSEEALTGTEANENGEEAEASAHNLYDWDGGEPRFLGRLSGADFESHAFAGINRMNLGAWTAALAPTTGGVAGGRSLAPTRATPDGGVFVFQSHAQLTSYDNEGVGEIYRYDPSAGVSERLLCVSCDPSGAAPSVDALLEDLDALGATSVVKSRTLIANLTDDGNRVFFQSFDRLLPEDANEVEDVYEWTTKGTGGCGRPGGCLALISTGQGEGNSFLYAMSADGRDVFFSTKERLVGMDTPDSASLYDAREGGGIPEPFVPSPCQGDDCQGNGAPPPGIPGAATTGAGEAPATTPATPCVKGKHRVKGRCVASKKHRHRKHRRRRGAHANRGGKR